MKNEIIQFIKTHQLKKDGAQISVLNFCKEICNKNQKLVTLEDLQADEKELILSITKNSHTVIEIHNNTLTLENVGLNNTNFTDLFLSKVVEFRIKNLITGIQIKADNINGKDKNKLLETLDEINSIEAKIKKLQTDNKMPNIDEDNITAYKAKVQNAINTHVPVEQPAQPIIAPVANGGNGADENAPVANGDKLEQPAQPIIPLELQDAVKSLTDSIQKAINEKTLNGKTFAEIFHQVTIIDNSYDTVAINKLFAPLGVDAKSDNTTITLSPKQDFVKNFDNKTTAAKIAIGVGVICLIIGIGGGLTLIPALQTAMPVVASVATSMTEMVAGLTAVMTPTQILGSIYGAFGATGLAAVTIGVKKDTQGKAASASWVKTAVETANNIKSGLEK